jgi:predicted O-methyltransferase YrrM
MGNPDRVKLEALLSDLPKLHYWPAAGGWSYGGFQGHHLRAIFHLAVGQTRAGELHTLETGAGLSTLALLCAGPRRHICIAPDGELRGRLMEQVALLGLDAAMLDFVEDRSENALPRIADRAEQFLDLALIDGNHGYPAPFVDFCYINKALKKNGLLLIDDVQLRPPRELALLLRSQPGWERVRDLGKLAVFRKQTAERFLPGHGEQPYVMANSVSEGAAGLPG